LGASDHVALMFKINCEIDLEKVSLPRKKETILYVILTLMM